MRTFANVKLNNIKVMGQNNYRKILLMSFYVVLAMISCWATGESLKLLQPTVPSIIWYVVAFMFFIGASIGSKFMCDSFNQDEFITNRRGKLIGGLLLFLFCWGVSMPTNTHTFFYRSYVDSKVNSDIGTTAGYLAQIKNDHAINTLIQQKQSELENQVIIRMGELESEITNAANPGFGPKSKEILASFATMLGVAKIDPLAYNDLSIDGRRRLCDAYRQKIFTLMNSKKENIRNSLSAKNKEYKKIAKVDYNNLELCRQYILNGQLNLNEPMDVKNVCDQLDRGYSTIKTYRDHVIFRDEIEKQRYTSPTPQTEVRRLLNVYDVWQDFLNGEYPGSFWFWILVSILVDLLAFVFFVLGTKKEDF